jgi:UV DNA damage endonuclease
LKLMRTFRLPGWDRFNSIVPFEREDDNRPAVKKAKKKKTKRQIQAEIEEFGEGGREEEAVVRERVPEIEVGMGGVENRVYWPVGMEEWLRPRKKVVKRKGGGDGNGIGVEEDVEE